MTRIKNIFILALMMLFHAGCIIVTAVTYKNIQDWKTTLEYFTKESPTMSEEVRHFALINMRILDEQRNILVVALILGAGLMSLFIFRGGIFCMQVFKKGKDNKLKETVPKKEIDTAKLNEVTVVPVPHLDRSTDTKADTNIEDTSTSSGCILNPIRKTFGRLFRYETKTTPREKGLGTAELGEVRIMSNLNRSAYPSKEDTYFEVCL